MEPGAPALDIVLSKPVAPSIPAQPPIKDVPTTLVPFFLPPNGASLLPVYNVQPPAPKTLETLIPPLTDSLIKDSSVTHIQQGLQTVLKTPITLLPHELSAVKHLQNPALGHPLHVYIPIDSVDSDKPASTATLNDPTDSDSPPCHFDRLVEEFQAQISSVSESPDLATAARLDSALDCKDPTIASLLPLPLSEPQLSPSTPNSVPSNTNYDTMSDSVSHTTEVSVITDDSRMDIDLPNPSSNRKKRVRPNVDYVALNAGNALAHEEEEISPKSVKRRKIAVSPPAHKSSPSNESLVHNSSALSSMLASSRRFGVHLQLLLSWLNALSNQPDSSDYKSCEVRLDQLPSLDILSDICTDLHAIELKSDLNEPTTITQFIACLRVIHTAAMQEISNLTTNGLKSLVLKWATGRATDETVHLLPKMASSLQYGMLSAICTFYLMIHPSFDRQYFSDENMEQSCEFSFLTLNEFLSPLMQHYAQSARADDEHRAVEELHSRKKPKKGKKPQIRRRKSVSAPILQDWQKTPLGSLATHLLTLTYESMEHLSELANVTSLPDEHIIQIIRLCRVCLFAPTMQTLYAPSLKIMRNLFVRYPAFRQTLFQEVFDCILDFGTGSATDYPATAKATKQVSAESRMESGQGMHVVTKTILTLLQANPPTLSDSNSAVFARESDLSLSSDVAIGAPNSSVGGSGTVVAPTRHKLQSLCRSFVKNLVDVVVERMDSKDDVYNVILGQMIHDLIAVVFKPRFPAAEMLLRDLLHQILILLSAQPSTSASSLDRTQTPPIKLNDRLRAQCATWLGLIGTTLVSAKLYMTTANMTQRPPVGDIETRLMQEGTRCPLCTASYAGKQMVSCSRCLRWFHNECFGIEPLPAESKCEWYCDACLVGMVHDMLAMPKSKEEDGGANSHLADNSGQVQENDHHKNRVSGERSEIETDVQPSETIAQKQGGRATHSAMKVLLLNYLNVDRSDIHCMDAKRYLLRNWLLENDGGNTQAMEDILRLQYHEGSSSLIHWPLDASNLTQEQLDVNPYLNIVNLRGDTFETIQKRKAIFPSKLACQIFLTRLSIASSAMMSIYTYFPKILDQLVALMNGEQAKMRALALRAITNMVDADMTLLREKHVYQAVEARLIDPSALTREKALNMLGRFILMSPSVISQYVPLIRDRVEDSAISVRKRAVRIIRSVCLLLPSSEHVVGMCVALAKRSSKYGESIKEMVLSLFKEIWFTSEDRKRALLDEAKEDILDPEMPQADMSASMTADDSQCLASERLTSYEKMEQMFQVLKATLRSDAEREGAWFVELMEFLKASGDLRNPFLKDMVKLIVDFLCGVGEEAEMEYERQRKCDALVEQHRDNGAMKRAAIAASNQNREEVIKKRLLYSLALNYISTVIPTMVGEHFHQLRMLLAVESPTPSTHALSKKTIETIAVTLSIVIPHIRHPGEEVWTAMLRDISQLLKNHGMPVISASLKCATAIARRTTDTWIRSLYAALASPLRKEVSSTTPSSTTPSQPTLHNQSVIRFLFTLSMLLKCYPLDPPTKLKEKDLATVDSIRQYRYGPHVEEVYAFIIHYWRSSDDRDVKTSAVLSLGHLAPGSPGIFVRPISEEILASALSPSSLEQLKAQALKTLHEFLVEEAQRMKNSVPSAQQQETQSLKSPAISKVKASVAPKGSNSSSDTEEYEESVQRTIDVGSEKVTLDTVMMAQSEDTDTHNNLAASRATNASVTPNAANSSDTGLSSTIVELYMKRILSLGLDKSIAIRSAALALMEQILKMGLTHPAHCVPTLVALETDEVLGESAHRTLSSMEIARVLNRIAVGIQTSFHFQKTLYRTPKAIRPVSDGGVVTYHSNLGRLYTLFADASKSARNNFLAAAFGLFEAQSEKRNGGFEVMFITYLTLLIAQLPFSTQEEALYAVYKANLCLSNLGMSSVNRLKHFYQALKSNPPTTESQKPSCPPANDMQDAIIIWHLLMLKLFLRHFYGLDKERCRTFMPSDAQATPISESVIHINIQDYLQRINASFDGFLIESDWAKKPDTCKRIYKNLKSALKSQEDDAVAHKTRRKSHAASNSSNTDAASTNASSAPRSTAPKGNKSAKHSKSQRKRYITRQEDDEDYDADALDY